MESFTDNLVLLLIDKVIIGIIAFILWHLYSTRMEIKKAHELKTKELKQETNNILRDKALETIRTDIDIVQKQIKDFYWPINMCMQIDDAIWKRVPSLHRNPDNLTDTTGEIVEKETIIPNHKDAVNIIKNNFHLIGEDKDLSNELIKYIRHVAVLTGLRISGENKNPVDVNEPFPQGLSDYLNQKLHDKIEELDRLNAEYLHTQKSFLNT